MDDDLNAKNTPKERLHMKAPIAKVGDRHQVVIAKSIWENIGLDAGDYVEMRIEDGEIILKPKKLVDARDVLAHKARK